MALRETPSSMTVLERGQSYGVAEDMPDNSKSHSKAMHCRGLAWPNIVLCIIIGFVALLLALPLMVFFFPRDDELDSLNSLSCSPLHYNGSACLLELQNWQSCLPSRQNDSVVLIPSNTKQDVQETKIRMLFSGLQSLHPSEGCMTAFRSFWCLVLFGLCDGSGQRRLPSYEECITLQTNSCAVEKQVASGIPDLAPLFQECEIFRLNTPVCRTENKSKKPLPINVTCSDQFYFDKSSMLCKPECGVWTQHSDITAQTINAFLIVGDVLGVLICTAVLLASFFQRKKMFTFPAVMILYQNVAILLVTALDLLRYAPRNTLVCSSKDLIESLDVEKSTFFCKFLAGLFFYVVLLVALLWLFHILMLSWGVIWPWHHQAYHNSGRMKYIHLTIVAASLLLPIISVLACQWSEGFGLSILSYYKCEGQGPKDAFYAVTVPLDIMIIIGTSVLLYIIWIIADMKNKFIKRKSDSKRKLTTPEIKLMIITIYYFFGALFNITTSTITLWRYEAFKNDVTEHFACEAPGVGNCSKENFNKFDAITNTIHYVWFSALPLIFFIYIFKCKIPGH